MKISSIRTLSDYSIFYNNARLIAITNIPVAIPKTNSF